MQLEQPETLNNQQQLDTTAVNQQHSSSQLLVVMTDWLLLPAVAICQL
jgi:hypothetical protein